MASSKNGGEEMKPTDDIKTPVGQLLKYILNKAGFVPIPIDDEFRKHIEALKKLQEVALEAAETLDEVRTGEDFECVCSDKAQAVRKALGIKGKYNDDE
jgi:hypothetical protein